MTNKRRIVLLEQYINLLAKENGSLIGWAHVHGWRASEEDIAEGKRIRKALKWDEDDDDNQSS